MYGPVNETKTATLWPRFSCQGDKMSLGQFPSQAQAFQRQERHGEKRERSRLRFEPGQNPEVCADGCVRFRHVLLRMYQVIACRLAISEDFYDIG